MDTTDRFLRTLLWFDVTEGGGLGISGPDGIELDDQIHDSDVKRSLKDPILSETDDGGFALEMGGIYRTEICVGHTRGSYWHPPDPVVESADVESHLRAEYDSDGYPTLAEGWIEVYL